MFIKFRFRIEEYNAITINDISINEININFVMKSKFLVLIVKVLFDKFYLISFL